MLAALGKGWTFMRYLIVGCGRVGSALAKYLDADGHEVIVVDENAAAFKRLGQKFKGHVVVGTGIDYDVLKRAGAATADGFVAVTNGDNRNIMAALIAQRMFKIKRVVARIYDPPRGQMYRELGVETVCPTTVGAKLIRDVLMEAPWNSLQSFDFGKLTAISAIVTHNDAGKTIGEIEKSGSIRIAAVRRASGGVVLASGGTLLEEGDEVSAVVAPDAISEFALRFSSATPAARMTA
jgi:trk system potassium uptake protein TrkA